MQKNLCLLAVALLSLAIPAVGLTPDGMPPSQETVCDSYSGAAFGLCNAYCEAMDCESPAPHASATACSKVGSHFTRITGMEMPCEATCPCTELSLFAAFVDGTAAVADCISGGGIAEVSATNGGYISISGNLTCSENSQAPFISLTQNQSDYCRQVLRDAAAAQGVTCYQPE